MTISTPDLCDEHPDKVQIVAPDFIHYGAKKQFYGQVETVQAFEDNSKVGELVRTPGQGRVLVVDGAGSRRRAMLGDMLACAAIENGWSGVVINGMVRDVEEIAVMDLGIMALGSIPIKTDKLGQGNVGVELAFANVKICSGDYLYADQSGIIISKQPLI